MKRSAVIVPFLALLVLLLPVLVSGCGCSATEQTTPTTTPTVAEATTAPTGPTSSVAAPTEPTSSHPPISHGTAGTSASPEPSTTTTSAPAPAPEPGGPEEPETTTTAFIIRPVTPVPRTVIPMIDPWTRYEDRDGYLKWTGPWTEKADPDASGGTYRYSDSDARLLAYFRGTRVALAAVLGTDRGKADVRLHRVPGGEIASALIDLYHPTKGIKTVWTGPVLEEGDYYLFVWWTGNKNPASAGTRVTVDAVDIMGTLMPWLGP